MGKHCVSFSRETLKELGIKSIGRQLELLKNVKSLFATEAIRSHILQWSQEKNRRLSDGYDFEVIYPCNFIFA